MLKWTQHPTKERQTCLTSPSIWKAAAGFYDDLAGIGSSTTTGNGRIAGAVNTSASAGGLVLSVSSGSLDGADGYLLAAHDGKPAKMAWSESDGFLRVTRTWRTESTLSSVPAVTFAFDLAELGIGSATVRLLYRANASSSFADTGKSGVLGGSVLSFTFAAGTYKDGEWMLAVDSVADSDGLCLDVLTSGDEVSCESEGGSMAWTTDGGITTLVRSWYVQSDSAFPAMRLNFLLGGIEDGEAYAVYYRASDTGTWICLPYPAAVANGTVSVKIPAGLATGYFTLGKIGAGEATSMPCAAVSDGLAGWYRADTGVTVVDGAVSVWRNIGLLGATADATKALGDGSATPSTSVFSEGGVNFGGSAYLKTASIRWTSSNDNTWFAVFKVADSVDLSDSGVSLSVFGNTDGTTRFGAMFPASTQLRLRTHGYVVSESTSYCQFSLENDTLGSAMIVDSLRNGSAVDTYVNGARKAGQKNASGESKDDTFNIGNMAGMGSKFKGDIAEIRVYNRAISDVERNIVANHLAARYGVTMDGNSLYGGATAGCKYDVVGIGCTTTATSSGTGVVHVPGNITVSDNSAGLTIAAIGSLSDRDYVLVGHGEKANRWVNAGDGVKRMKRAWHITKTNASSLDLKLAFRLSDAGIEPLEDRVHPQYKLLRSLDGGTTWIGVEVALMRNGQEFTCALPAATFAEGQYTLGADVVAPGFVIILR